MSTVLLSKKLGPWKAQIANVKPRLPELPQLVETVQGFEALVSRARSSRAPRTSTAAS